MQDLKSYYGIIIFIKDFSDDLPYDTTKCEPKYKYTLVYCNQTWPEQPATFNITDQAIRSAFCNGSKVTAATVVIVHEDGSNTGHSNKLAGIVILMYACVV